MRIRWTQPAFHDFKNISHRIQQERNLTAANRVCRRIYDAVQILRRHPHTGRPGAEEGTRELIVPQTPYVVVYRLQPEAVQVLRIWHGAQDRG